MCRLRVNISAAVSSSKLLLLLAHRARLLILLPQHYFTMAQRAMLELQVLQLSLQRLMLAGLARVVFLGEYALAAGNARTEVGTAFFAVDVTRLLTEW